MDFKKQIWKIESYFRTFLPASVCDDTLRKLAFTYYCYKRVINRDAFGFLDANDVTRQITKIASGEFDKNTPFSDDEFVQYFLNNYAPFESRHELASALEEGLEDCHYFGNDGQHTFDIVQISNILASLSESELLEILNVQFEGSSRDNSTPESVSNLVLEIAKRYSISTNKAFDMACSTGSFLLKAAKDYKYIGGVEINKENTLIAKMRMFANRINANIRNDNCFRDSWSHQASSDKYDLVFSEFPWKMVVKDYGQKEEMYKCDANRFCLQPNTTTDYFFISAMMNYLNQEGVAITVVPLSILSNLADTKVREHILKRGFVKEIIALPSSIFERTNVATALVVLSFEKQENVFMFDASSYFLEEKRWIKSIDINKLLNDYDFAKNNKIGFHSLEEISKKGYSLSPLHYSSVVTNILPNAREMGEVADIFTGWQVPSAKLETIHKTDGTGIQLLQMSNVENGTIVSKLERYDVPQKSVDKFKVEKGDVVISTKSLRVKSAVVDLDTNEPVIASGSIMVIRPKKELLDPYYLVAYFESDLGKKAIELYQTGSVIPNLSINNVKRIPVPFLEYKKQVEIGNNYRELRDLILSEKRRLNLLETKIRTMLDGLWDKRED